MKRRICRKLSHLTPAGLNEIMVPVLLPSRTAAHEACRVILTIGVVTVTDDDGKRANERNDSFSNAANRSSRTGLRRQNHPPPTHGCRRGCCLVAHPLNRRSRRQFSLLLSHAQQVFCRNLRCRRDEPPNRWFCLYLPVAHSARSSVRMANCGRCLSPWPRISQIHAQRRIKAQSCHRRSLYPSDDLSIK